MKTVAWWLAVVALAASILVLAVLFGEPSDLPQRLPDRGY